MSISKRSVGVEGYKTTNKSGFVSTPTISQLKNAAPSKIKNFTCIDKYKKGSKFCLIYEDLAKRHIFINIEIDQIQSIENFINLVREKI